MRKIPQLLIEIDTYIKQYEINKIYSERPNYVINRFSEVINLMDSVNKNKALVRDNELSVVGTLSDILKYGITANSLPKYNTEMVSVITEQNSEEVNKIREKAKEEITTLEEKIKSETKEKQQIADTVELLPEPKTPKELTQRKEPINIYAQPSDAVRKFTKKKASERAAPKPRLLNYSPKRAHAMQRLRSKPKLNPYKSPEYFDSLIERQRKTYMVTENTHNEDTQPILPPQSQQDAYFAYQITNLISEASKSCQWDGFTTECREIKIELAEAIKKGYASLQLKKHFGPEMAVLNIIKRDTLPKELSKLVDKLLPTHF